MEDGEKMEVGRNGDEDGREERVERKVKMREKVKSGNYVTNEVRVLLNEVEASLMSWIRT